MNRHSPFFTKLLLNIFIVFFILLNNFILIVSKSSGHSQAPITNSENLSNNPGNSTDPQIALYQNNVYVIWSDDSTGNEDIYFKRSTDNGTTFDSTNNISNNTGISSSPQIAATGNNVFIVWSDTSSGSSEIYYKQSLNQGSEFTSIKTLSKTRSIDGEHASMPKVYASGNNVYVAWQDRVFQNNEIFFRSSLDAGNKFTGIKNLSRNNTGDSIFPEIIASGNNAFVVWSDTSSGKSEIFLRTSFDGGNRFGGLKNVSWSTGSSYDPKIALFGNSLYIIWEDNSQGNPTFDLTLRASHDAGQNFADKQNLARYIGQSSDYGQVSAEANNVYIVWSESPRYTYPPQYEIFFKMSRDNGTHFGDGVNLSNNEGNSIEPRMAVSSTPNNNSTLFVVWSDSFKGNSDIHFIKLDNLL